jgi:hypothetical protein
VAVLSGLPSRTIATASCSRSKFFINHANLMFGNPHGHLH